MRLFLIFLLFSFSSSQTCPAQLMTLDWTSCKVSYSNCDNNVGFTFIGCTQRYCADYSYNTRTNSSQCVRYADRVHNQTACTSVCCLNHPLAPFTYDSLTQCKKDDQEIIKQAGIIAGSVLGGIAVIAIVIVLICCIQKNGGCQNSCGGCAQKCGDCCRGCGECLGNCKECCFYQNDSPLPINLPQNNTTHVIIHHDNVPAYPTMPVIPPIDKNFIQRNTNLPGYNYGDLPWLSSPVQLIQKHEKCEVCKSEYPDTRASCGHSFHFRCLLTHAMSRDNCPQCLQNIEGIMRIVCRKCKKSFKQLTMIPKITNQKEIKSKMGSYQCYTCLSI